ncbi:SGNH hydrolase domain-containing protein [Lacimonas salitolerans]|uniref:SGNH hydrolase domain-containing protein n=1 Tax=Lacimonas salitolerans TaxID=1323750 RepID=A0ABW4EKV1_9RHOB
MPSPENRTLCIFGDSHLGSVRRALDAGLIDLDGFDVEFWGVTGPLFRTQLHMLDGVLTPTGPDAAAMVEQVNGNGRATLSADDFDVILFYAARLRIWHFQFEYLHRQHRVGQRISQAVLRAAAQGFLLDRRMARAAREFGRQGKAQILFAPTPYPTRGIGDYYAHKQLLARFPDAIATTETARADMWQIFVDAFAQDGVTLLHQPGHTVVDGLFTDTAYATEGAAENVDISHKSPEFAALMLQEFMAAVK